MTNEIAVGTRVRAQHWVVPRPDAWRYGTVIGHRPSRCSLYINWGSYCSWIDPRQCAHFEPV